MSEDCRHLSVMPEFDAKLAIPLDWREVRKRWPRFCGECPECKVQVIVYAS